MICKKPFKVGIIEYGCGQCLPCRIDRRRMWTCRLMLEARKHESSFFLTLTYNKENLPYGSTLVPKHLQDYLKRLRYHLDGVRIRFYGVGEYGERRGRPHYHLVVFGASRAAMIDAHEVVQWVTPFKFDCRTWEYGQVDIRDLSWDLAWYIMGYICNKRTKRSDFKDGRHPEFARMSLRPGIGAVAVEDIAASLNNWSTTRYITENGDVPAIIRLQGKKLPMGRYLLGKLREAMGYPREAPAGAMVKKAQELYLELTAEGGLLRREEKRVQSSRNAESRVRLSNSKRDIE